MPSLNWDHIARLCAYEICFGHNKLCIRCWVVRRRSERSTTDGQSDPVNSQLIDAIKTWMRLMRLLRLMKSPHLRMYVCNAAQFPTSPQRCPCVYLEPRLLHHTSERANERTNERGGGPSVAMAIAYYSLAGSQLAAVGRSGGRPADRPAAAARIIRLLPWPASAPCVCATQPPRYIVATRWQRRLLRRRPEFGVGPWL